MFCDCRSFWKENKAWIITHAGCVGMAMMLAFHPSSWKVLTPYSGFTAVGFLILVLSLSPLKTLFPSLLILTYCNRYRREIGVACFSYALIHLICFIIKRGGVVETLLYLLHPALIPVFWIAFPIFTLLALTSNQISLKKLGFLKWKKLHKWVYCGEVCVFLHMILVGESFYAFLLFCPLFTLQLIVYLKKKRAKSKISS